MRDERKVIACQGSLFGGRTVDFFIQNYEELVESVIRSATCVCLLIPCAGSPFLLVEGASDGSGVWRIEILKCEPILRDTSTQVSSY